MLSRLLNHHRRGGGSRVVRGPGPGAGITLRLATAKDEQAVERLAALYDQPIPQGPLLLAEVDGQLQAALALAGDRELMEPYLPTAELVELLALRVKHLAAQITPAARRAGESQATTLLRTPDPYVRNSP